MEEFISAAAGSLADFLKEKKSEVKSLQQVEILTTFIYRSDQIFDQISINALLKNQDPIFFINKPDSGYKLIGLAKTAAFSENGSQRFSAAEKKIKEYKSRWITNCDSFPSLKIPLIFSAVKFTPEHSEHEWKSFSDSEWVIPELILIRDEKNSYIIFNSISSTVSLLKNLTVRFMKILENMLKSDSESASAKRVKEKIFVRQIDGNLPKDKKKWKKQVNELIEEITAGNIRKVVLSRKIELLLSNDLAFSEILEKLSNRFPSCCIFLYRSGDSVFFGASPENLVKLISSSAEFDILAGSAPRGISADEDAALENGLLSSTKNLDEHKIVLEYVKDALNQFIEKLAVSETSVKKYSNIQHLWTRVSAKLKADCSVHAVLKSLYPTPSICGMPKEKALLLIKRTEAHKRGLYSGLIGWMDFNNTGEFIIAIRSALYYRRKLLIFAGNGIVKDSNPDEEWKETELKLNPILSLFNENKN